MFQAATVPAVGLRLILLRENQLKGLPESFSELTKLTSLGFNQGFNSGAMGRWAAHGSIGKTCRSYRTGVCPRMMNIFLPLLFL